MSGAGADMFPFAVQYSLLEFLPSILKYRTLSLEELI